MCALGNVRTRHMVRSERCVNDGQGMWRVGFVCVCVMCLGGCVLETSSWSCLSYVLWGRWRVVKTNLACSPQDYTLWIWRVVYLVDITNWPRYEVAVRNMPCAVECSVTSFHWNVCCVRWSEVCDVCHVARVCDPMYLLCAEWRACGRSSSWFKSFKQVVLVIVLCALGWLRVVWTI